MPRPRLIDLDLDDKLGLDDGLYKCPVCGAIFGPMESDDIGADLDCCFCPGCSTKVAYPVPPDAPADLPLFPRHKV